MSSVSCEILPPEFRAALANPDLIDRELARRSLNDFSRRMLNLEPARHHLFVNEKLEAVERGGSATSLSWPRGLLYLGQPTPLDEARQDRR